MTRITNVQFGARIGVTVSYVSHIRHGNRLPSGDLLVKIIRCFDLDPGPAMDAYALGAGSFAEYLNKAVFNPEPVAGP